MTEKSKSTHKEREHHHFAFELYLGMGFKRSYRAIATELGVSVSTIKNWARWYHWQRRIQIQQRLQTEQLAKGLGRENYDQADHHRKVIDAALGQMARSLMEGKLKSTPRYLIKLESLIQQLMRRLDGQPDQNEPVAAAPRTVIILPDNGRDPKERSVIPKSELEDYLTMSRRQ